MNNCPCILCHIGRSCGYHSSDFAPIEKVIAAIQSYDLSQSPYTFCEEERQSMIAYAREKAPNGSLHFESLEYFWEERGKQP